jgi:hypothetical protein
VLQAGVLCVPLLRLSMLQLELISQVVSNKTLVGSDADSEGVPSSKTSDLARSPTKRAKKRVRHYRGPKLQLALVSFHAWPIAAFYIKP